MDANLREHDRCPIERSAVLRQSAGSVWHPVSPRARRRFAERGPECPFGESHRTR